MKLPPAHPVPSLGEFLWPQPRPASQALLADPQLSLTFNARGALLEVGCELLQTEARRDEVLVPGYHCPSGITPLIEAGLKPVYYRVRPDLAVDWHDLLGKVGTRTRAVLVIHYFGFETDLEPLQALRERGVALIEDWSHAFLRVAPLSLPRPQGDYQVFSFWKLAPCGVGGGVRRLGLERTTGWLRQASAWRESLVRNKRELEELLEYSSHRGLHRAFQALEDLRRLSSGAVEVANEPYGPGANPSDELTRGEDRYDFDPQLARAAMPARVRKRLMSTDLEAIALRRRGHYARLGDGLPQTESFVPLQPTLDAHTCPWVYPVRLRDRDRIDRGWRKKGVALHTFGIWLHSGLQQADRHTREDAQQLARETLCLSVHQGLHEQDLDNTIAVIRRHFGKA